MAIPKRKRSSKINFVSSYFPFSLLTLGLVRFSIAAHVDSHGVVAETLEGGQLVAPAEPALGKTVHKEHQLAVGVARRDVVQLDARLGEGDEVMAAVGVQRLRRPFRAAPVLNREVLARAETNYFGDQAEVGEAAEDEGKPVTEQAALQGVHWKVVEGSLCHDSGDAWDSENDDDEDDRLVADFPTALVVTGGTLH